MALRRGGLTASRVASPDPRAGCCAWPGTQSANATTGSAKVPFEVGVTSSMKVISSDQENPFEPPPFRRCPNEPQFCCFSTRVAIFIFTGVAGLFHAIRFLFLLSNRFKQYGKDMAAYGVPGLHEANVALEVLSLLPVGVSFYGAYWRTPCMLMGSAVANVATLVALSYLHIKGAVAEAWLRSHGKRPGGLAEKEAKAWQTSAIANRITFTVMDWILHGLLCMTCISYANFMRKHGVDMKKYACRCHEATYYTDSDCSTTATTAPVNSDQK